MYKLIKNSIPWSSKITLATFILALIFSGVSTFFREGFGLILSTLIVVIFILIGIIGDTVGLSAATANEARFHSKAAKKVPGAKEAAYISKNAPLFSSFFNDVMGDIAGIVSGAASVSVVLQIALIMQASNNSFLFIIISVVVTSFIAALTVGGKAICKTIAIEKSTEIIMFTGKVIYVGKTIKRFFRLKTFKRQKDQPAQKK